LELKSREHNRALLAEFQLYEQYEDVTVFEEDLERFESAHRQSFYRAKKTDRRKVYTCKEKNCAARLIVTRRSYGLWLLFRITLHTCVFTNRQRKFKTRNVAKAILDSHSHQLGSLRDDDIRRQIEEAYGRTIHPSMFKHAKRMLFNFRGNAAIESYQKIPSFCANCQYGAYEVDSQLQLTNAFFLVSSARQMMLRVIPVVSVDATFADGYLLATAHAVDPQKHRIPIAYGILQAENAE